MREILVVNCGSSSLKVDVFSYDPKLPATDDAAFACIASAAAERLHSPETQLKFEVKASPKRDVAGAEEKLSPGERDHAGALRDVAEFFARHDVFASERRLAVGHRIVHGGPTITKPARLDAATLQTIEACAEFAPLHNPPNLAGVRAAREIFGELNGAHVGVFDTAFHATMPAFAYTYALPQEMAERHGLRRFGFHGTSHEYVGRKAAELLKKPFDEVKVITLHLGNGASACAIQHGRSVDTSMGFTPLEGLAMGTRCGDLDPAIVPVLMEKENLDTDAVDLLLNKQSGLKGLAGVNDMRDLLQRANAGDESAELAVDVFCYRIRKYVGAYLATLDGADAIVFTAGIGENAAEIRRRVMSDFEYAGIFLDEGRNNDPRKFGGTVSPEHSKTLVAVIPTDEELMIAKSAAGVVGE